MRMLVLSIFAASIACSGDDPARDGDTDTQVDTTPPDPADDTDDTDHHTIPPLPIDTGLTRPGGGDSGVCGFGDEVDCNDRCWPAYFVGDGHCDDGEAFRSDFDCAQHGFDGGDCLSETDPPLPAEVGCPVIVRTFSGNWGAEVGWKITKNNRTVLNKAFGAFGANNLLYADLLFLDPGSYRFVLRDLLGDGWNGATYTITGPGGVEFGTGTLGSGFSRTDSFTVVCEQDTGAPVAPPADCGDVTLRVNTLQFGHQIGWQLKDRNHNVLVSAPFNTYANNRTYEHAASLPEGWYVFTMLDDYGDGWNGATYQIVDDATGLDLSAGTLPSGSSLDVPFLMACTPGFDPGPPPLIDGIACDDLYVRARTGPDADQVGWQILDARGAVAVEMQPGSYASFGEFLTPVHLATGAWTVRLLDAMGDGWEDTTVELVDLNSGFQFVQGGPAFTAGRSFDLTTEIACTQPAPPVTPLCADGSVEDCDGVCWPAAMVGDGWCDDGAQFAANFACSRFQWDRGDCAAP